MDDVYLPFSPSTGAINNICPCTQPAFSRLSYLAFHNGKNQQGGGRAWVLLSRASYVTTTTTCFCLCFPSCIVTNGSGWVGCMNSRFGGNERYQKKYHNAIGSKCKTNSNNLFNGKKNGHVKIYCSFRVSILIVLLLETSQSK